MDVPVRPEVRKIATVSALFFAVLYTGLQLLAGIEGEKLLQSIAKIGGVLTAIGLFWTFYVKVGWRFAPLRLGGWLSSARS